MRILLIITLTALTLSGTVYENLDIIRKAIYAAIESLEIEANSEDSNLKDSLIGEWVSFQSSNFDAGDGIGIVFTENNLFGFGAVSDGNWLKSQLFVSRYTLEGNTLTLVEELDGSIEEWATMDIKILANRILILTPDKLSGHPLVSEKQGGKDVFVRLR